MAEGAEGTAPHIDAFTGQAGGAPAGQSISVHRGDKVTLRWKIAGEIVQLQLAGQVLDPGQTEMELVAETDTMYTLAAANPAGSSEAHLFVDVLEPGEVVSEHAVLAGADTAAAVAADGEDAADAGVTGLLWAQLFDEEGEAPLADLAYQIEGEGRTLSGQTDGQGKLRHESVPAGFYQVRVEGGVGTIPVSPGEASAAYGALVRGIRPAGQEEG